MISIDSQGHIEYWDPKTGDFPKLNLTFNCKLDSDLFILV